jgi:hypothetical protein
VLHLKLKSRQELSKDIEVNAKELSTFKEVVAGINQSNLSKINELSTRVINLQDKVSTISCFRSSKSKADSQMAGHRNIEVNDSRSEDANMCE